MGAEEPTTESLQAAYMLEPGLWNADASGLRQVYALGYAAARAERDHLSRLHEIATENAARYSAVIEKAIARWWRSAEMGDNGMYIYDDPEGAMDDLWTILATVDAAAILRERDAAKWDEGERDGRWNSAFQRPARSNPYRVNGEGNDR